MRTPDNEEDAPSEFELAFTAAIDRVAPEGEPVVVLFSGGLDSSLIAWELRDRPGTVLWSIGRDGSPDLVASRTAAQALDLPWQHAVVGPLEVADAIARFAPELEGADGPPFDVAVAFALAMDRAPAARLVAGQGADELFLGYAHFRDLPTEQAGRRAEADLRRLMDVEWPRTERIAARAGRQLKAPFLEPEVRAAALRIPIADRLPADLPKRWLREWAVRRGLPAEIAARPKRAIQYGSQVHRILRELRPLPRSR